MLAHVTGPHSERPRVPAVGTLTPLTRAAGLRGLWGLGGGRGTPGSAACPSFWLPLRWCPSPALPAFGECPWEALLLPASVVSV